MLVGLGQIEETGALGAERSLVDGMVGIAFDVEDLSCRLIHAADKTAADGTVTADRRYLFGNFNAVHFAELVRICPGRIQVEPQARQGNPASDGAGQVKKPLLVICIKSLPNTCVNFGLCQTWHTLTESHKKVNMLYKT